MANLLERVDSWLYYLGDVTWKIQNEIADSDVDLVVIDYATYDENGFRLHTLSELKAMRGSNDKLIVSYISIGEAEDYRPYWQPSWDAHPPIFLSASNPEWPDNFKVRYWEKSWQDIIFKYVDDIIEAGFNGLYMDIVDGFQYWEEVAPHAEIDYRQEMANFVAAIRDRAEKALARLDDKREFVLIGQNGEELLENPKYLSAIDGVAKEDLRFHYPNERESSFRPVPAEWFEESKRYLMMAEAKGVEVFIVEYMTKARQAEYAHILKAEINHLKSNSIPLYIAEDRNLDMIYEQHIEKDKPGMLDDPTESLPASGTDQFIDVEKSGCSGGRREFHFINGCTGGDKLFWEPGSGMINDRGGPNAAFGSIGIQLICGRPNPAILYGANGNHKLYGVLEDEHRVEDRLNCMLFGDAAWDLFETAGDAVAETSLCYTDDCGMALADGAVQETDAASLF